MTAASRIKAMTALMKLPVGDDSAVKVEDEVGEVWFPDNCRDERIDDVLGEGCDDAGEGCADDDGDGQIQDIAAEDEVTKAFEHRLISLKRR